MIRKYLKKSYKNWDEHIAEFLFRINMAVEDPFQTFQAMLNYGRNTEHQKSLRRQTDAEASVNAVNSEKDAIDT